METSIGPPWVGAVDKGRRRGHHRPQSLAMTGFGSARIVVDAEIQEYANVLASNNCDFNALIAFMHKRTKI